MPLGIIDGITTNPSLLAKEAGDTEQILQEDLPDRAGPDQRRGRRHRLRGHDARGPRLAAIDKHIVVKVPFTRDGVQGVQGARRAKASAST